MTHMHKYETDYRGYTCCRICGMRPTMEAIEEQRRVIVFPSHFNNSRNEVTVFMKLEKKKRGDENMNEDTKIILDYLILHKLSYQHKYREIIVLDCFNCKELKDLAELGFFYDGDNLKYDVPKNIVEKVLERRKE